MGRERVQVHAHIAADPAAVWAMAREFGGAWHPWIATIRTERDAQGHLIRAFTVTGEPTLYREQLTYFSDSDRVLAYTHLEGIAGAESYDARLTVSAAEAGGSVVTWTATIAAPAARLAAICDGTRAVFEAGVEALRGAGTVHSAPPQAPAPTLPITEMTIDDLPRLGLSVTPDLGDGRLCLFLHGIGGNRRNWHSQLAAVGHHIRAAALDLRGYGDSTLGQRGSTVDDYCADILRVAQVLGARRLVLVGLSYGSWIATSFAMRHPEMLDGLVLSGGCTGMSEAGPEEREAFRLSREVPLNAGQVPADFAPAVVKVLAGPEASDAVRAELLASMAAIQATTYRDALVCFTNPLERFDFARLTMPVLMMTGEHDRLAPPSEIRGVAGRIWDSASRPDVRFEVIAGAGHVCNVENPGDYSRHLTAFLQGLPA
jgi:pimeloyl-ACP methyl ester carboxylesterase